MALLTQLIRTAAITGRTDTVNAWFASRQGGRWAEQTVQKAFPKLPNAAGPRPPAPPRPSENPEVRLRKLTELHRRGDLTDAEWRELRATLRI